MTLRTVLLLFILFFRLFQINHVLNFKASTLDCAARTAVASAARRQSSANDSSVMSHLRSFASCTPLSVLLSLAAHESSPVPLSAIARWNNPAQGHTSIYSDLIEIVGKSLRFYYIWPNILSNGCISNASALNV